MFIKIGDELFNLALVGRISAKEVEDGYAIYFDDKVAVHCLTEHEVACIMSKIYVVTKVLL